jgi:ComF family protein
VPLHKEREKWRGFNQAKKIALGLSWNTKDVLARVRMTKAQAQLGREDRLVNVKDAFQVVLPAQVKDKIIVLVDDVFTTGSTLENCALVLKSNGAKKIFAFTWAGG